MKNSAIRDFLTDNDYHLEDGLYVHTYNSVRHWADVQGDTIRMYSVYEGTAGDEPIFDTGVIETPTKEFLTKQLNKQRELRWEA